MTDESLSQGDTPAPDANALSEAPQEQQAPAESSPAPEVEAEEPKPKGVAKRIDELTRNWREAQRQNERLLDLLSQRNTPAQPDAPKQEAPQQQVKTLADFNFDEPSYQKYLIQHATEQARAVAREEARKEREEQERATRQQQRIAGWQERAKAFAATTEDFEEVAYAAPISDGVAALIQDLEEGPEVAYHLGKNPAEARRISQMSEAAAGIALGKLAAQLAFERKTAEEAKKRVSQAPPPTPKIEGLNSGPAIRPDSPESDNLSMSEWMKARNKQVQNRKRG